MEKVAIYCADVGSVKTGKFGWAKLCGDDSVGGTDIRAFVQHIAADMHDERPVAVGFECPLFVPVREDPMELTSARVGEGSRAWSAGAGCGALATGIVEVRWVLHQLKKAAPDSAAYLNWEDVRREGRGLFIWEAFVSGGGKMTVGPNLHVADALAAARAFEASLPKPASASMIEAGEVLSLVGAALLHTGWEDDVTVLRRPCLVIGPQGR